MPRLAGHEIESVVGTPRDGIDEGQMNLLPHNCLLEICNRVTRRRGGLVCRTVDIQVGASAPGERIAASVPSDLIVAGISADDVVGSVSN